MNPTIYFIDTHQAYLDTLATLQTEHIFFLDTEFIRETTYRPIPALLQIAVNPDEAYLIDPTFPEFDVQPLVDILQAKDSLIVMHSARQDIEIFYFRFGFIPHNLIDTQIIAAILGYGEQIGYDNLVKAITGDLIDKSQQRTNWLTRPLEQAQIEYAASDVLFLARIYPLLQQELHEKNRQDWIQDDINDLCNPNIFDVTPKQLAKKIRHKLTNKVSIAILTDLVVLREKSAMKHDVIRNRICADALLIKIAEKKPTSLEDLEKIKVTRNQFIYKNHEAILSIIADAPHNISVTQPPERKQPFTVSQEHLASLLSLSADITAYNQKISRRLFATQADITEFVSVGNARFMSGWRYDLFGNIVDNITQGKQNIACIDGKVTLNSLVN